MTLLLREMVQEWILHYGYYALYGLLAIGIVGLPVPDEILMTFVGYVTSIGFFDYRAALLVSFSGAMTGMLISYYLGKKVGKPFLWRYGKWIKLTPGRLEKAEGWFRRYGLWTVCFGYFVPGVRHFTCYLAGVSGVRLWRYLAYAGSGALVWCATFITLGRIIGSNVEPILRDLHRYGGMALAIAIVLAVIGSWAYYRLHRGKAL